MSPAEAGKLYGISAKTFVAWFDAGKIRGKRITTKAYQIHVDDLPRVIRS
jgi:predicted site-specific integrase-resolvase